MSQKKIRCMRCRGVKKLYKVGTAYANIDTGGVKVDCPMCLGTGEIKPLEDAIETVSNEIDATFKNISGVQDSESPSPEKKKAKKNDITIKSTDSAINA